MYEDRYWLSEEGLKLHYRDYPGPADRPPILCLPGLTRNARDFANLAALLSPRWRVLAVDLRGRGKSEYAKDPMTYLPLTYARDVQDLLRDLEIDRYVAFGTSLGGLLTMILAASGTGEIAGAMLNDVGPELEPGGLGRIRTYVGKSQTWPTWMHAARAVGEANRDVYPGYAIEDWLAMAKRLYRLNSSGRVVLDYDMKIAEPFRVPGNESGTEMWHAFEQLKKVPTLIVRGGLSDLFAASVADRMLAALDQGELVTVPDVGHTPTLDEPEVVDAVERLLAQVAKEPVAA